MWPTGVFPFMWIIPKAAPLFSVSEPGGQSAYDGMLGRTFLSQHAFPHFS